MLDWNDLRYFLAVANAGSLSRAASALDVTQPTVGRRIRALEQQLECRLFDRQPSGYVLTQNGRDILGVVEQMDSQAHAVARSATGRDLQLEGRVVLTIPIGLHRWVVRALPPLQQAYPALDLELSVRLSRSDLLRHEADIALRVGDAGSAELVGRRVGSMGFGMYASEDYLQQHGEPLPGTLATHVIIESTGELTDVLQARMLRNLAADAGVAARLDCLETQCVALQMGAGLLALPNIMAAELSGVRRVMSDSFRPVLDIWALTHADLRATARVRAVVDYFTEKAGQDAAALLDGSS